MSQGPVSYARAARRLRQLTLAGIGLLAVMTLSAAIVLLLGGPAGGGVSVAVEDYGLPPWPAAIINVIVAALLGYALWQLSQMLRLVEMGDPFATGGALRKFALYLFLSVLGSIVLPPLAHLLTIVGQEGKHQLTLALDGNDLLMMFVTGLLSVVARLLDEAQSVAEEHRQFI